MSLLSVSSDCFRPTETGSDAKAHQINWLTERAMRFPGDLQLSTIAPNTALGVIDSSSIQANLDARATSTPCPG